MISVDHFGLLLCPNARNRLVIVAIQHATRHVETAPLPEGTAQTTAYFPLHSIIVRHGAPPVLITDRGDSCLAHTVEILLRACNVVNPTTIAYHPKTNDLMKRLNHTFANMISMYVSIICNFYLQPPHPVHHRIFSFSSGELPRSYVHLGRDPSVFWGASHKRLHHTGTSIVGTHQAAGLNLHVTKTHYS